MSILRVGSRVSIDVSVLWLYLFFNYCVFLCLCSPSAIPLPLPPTLRFTLPLTAPPHPKAKEGETNGNTSRPHRGEQHTTNHRLPSLVHRPQRRYTRHSRRPPPRSPPPALIPCITLERTTNETGTIHHHPTATELTLVRYQYPHDSDTWLYIGDGSRSHGLDITLESARRLVSALARYVEDEG